MKDFNIYKIGLCFALFSIGVFIVTGFFSLRAYKSSKDFENQLISSVHVLKQDIVRLEAHIEEFGNLMKEKQIHLSTAVQKKDDSVGKVIAGGGIKKMLPSPGEDLKKIEEKKQMDRMAVIGDIDLEVLQELYEERVKEKNIQSQAVDFRARNAEQRQFDTDQYDEELNDLYRRALPRRFGNRVSEEERESAFEELLDKYPDSYAAAKVVSTQAIVSVRRNNMTDAENYYRILVEMQNKKSDNVVLDNGMEAVPTVAYTLASTYYRRGYIEEFDMMVKSLEDNYSDSLYRIRSPNNSRLVTGEEAISRLRSFAGIAPEFSM